MNIKEGFRRLSILIGIIGTLVFFFAFVSDAGEQIGLVILVSLVVGLVASGITLLIGYVLEGFKNKNT